MSRTVPDRDPSEHPDQDVLADLAADVLPAGDAGRVQEHVQACERCAGLLADAEGVRRLLLADDIGPMPAQVLARIEAAIADAGSLPVSADGADGARTPPTVPDRPRPVRPPGRPGGRTTRGSERTRRQVLAEDRDARPGRRGSLLLAAAAVALVLAGGGLGLRALTQGGFDGAATTAEGGASGGDSAESGGGSAAEPEAAARDAAAAVVVATGTAYTEQRLSAQVKALVNQVTAARASAGTEDLAPLRQRTSGNQALRSPPTLQACLAAIDSRGEQPIAVDLARYERREAAIVVLPGRDGGYEVWAVTRTCGPGGDGTLKFAAIR